MFQIVQKVINLFLNSNTFQQGAALAYYAVFSFLPMILLVSILLGVVFGKQAVDGEIHAQLNHVLGNEAALQIQQMIKNQHVQHSGHLSTLLGFVALALSASGMFNQIHSSFNSIWSIKSKPKSSILQYLSLHAVSIAIIIMLFFIMLLSTMMTSFLLKYSASLESVNGSIYFLEHAVSFTAIWLIFGIMFKVLGDADVHWKPVLIAGFFTSILFVIGKIGIGMYIGHSHLQSTFGAASVLALLMLWVYYTSQIIFLGAAMVRVISDEMGYDLLPNKNAVAVKHVEVDHS